MTRAVLDPGVLISGLLSPRAAPASLLQAWRKSAFELVVSPLLLTELARTLHRAKFRRYHTLYEAQAFVDLLRFNAALHPDPDIPVGATPDPDDDYLVGLSRACRADVLVSGDRHLIDLDDPNPPVLTPRQFLDLIEAEQGNDSDF